MNRYFVALFCLAVAISSVLSLECCIGELEKKIGSLNITSSLSKKQEFVKYDVCVMSVEDGNRFKSVYAEFIQSILKVGVVYTAGDTATRSYTFRNIDEHTYTQTDEDTKVGFTVYPIFVSDEYIIEYGCINDKNCQDGFPDKTPFVQCVFRKDTTNRDYEGCKERLDAVVGDYIKTKIICLD